MLALEDAKLVPHPPEPRGNLEETRLDVVSAVESRSKKVRTAGVPTPEPASRACAFGITVSS